MDAIQDENQSETAASPAPETQKAQQSTEPSATNGGVSHAPAAVAATGAGDTAVSEAPKRPRGRPRKDGLRPGSPEAKAADASPRTRTDELPPASSTMPAPAAPMTPPAAKPGPAVSSGSVPTTPAVEAPRPKRGRPEPIAPPPPPPAPAAPIVTKLEPLDYEEGYDLVEMTLAADSALIGLFSPRPISGPTPTEVKRLTPPVIRLLLRAGIGKGALSVDVIVVLVGLGMYTRARIGEARGTPLPE